MKARDLREQAAAFRAYNLSRNLSPKTIETYSKNLSAFFHWADAGHGPDVEVDPRLIRRFMADKFEAGRRPNTVRAYLITLRALFSFLVADGVIEEQANPMRHVKNPKMTSERVRPLAPEEVKVLLNTFDKTSLVDYRNYIICLLMLDTGMRVGEVLRLTLDDVDTEKQEIRVKGKGRKNRTVYIGQKMRERLLDYIERCRPWIAKRDGTLFPPERRSQEHTMRSHYLSEIIREKMKQAGMWTPHSSSHRLRHTFAISFLRRGANAFHLQKALGHSTLKMTETYVLLADGHQREACLAASPVDGLDI